MQGRCEYLIFVRKEGVCLKIILKYILNNIRERLLRTAVMLLSVILSSTLLFVSLSIGDSYESAQLKKAKGFAGRATISVSAKPDKNGRMVWISDAEIPVLSTIESKVGILTVQALFRENGYYENIDLLAADLDGLNAVSKPRLMDNAVLSNFEGNSIVLPEKFTSKYGVKPGDTIALTIGGNEYGFRLAAAAAYDTVFLRETRGFNALVPKGTLSGILGASNANSKILIVPAAGIETDKLKTGLSSAMSPQRYNVDKVYNEEEISKDAKEKSLPFYLISFFSFIMSIFIIFSSYKVITLERLPVIGTFRSIGATEKAVMRILMLESLIYGLAGGLAGIPLGFWALKLILNELGKSLSLGIEIPMVVSPVNILISCITAIAVTMLSTLIPARKAGRLPVKDVVLGTVEEKRSSDRLKLGAGLVLFVLSILLPYIPAEKNGGLLMAAGGFSLLGLITSTIIIVPMIVNALSVVLEQLYGVILGNEGRLAARNMKENKNINQNITLLVISLSAVVVISVITGFLASYIGDVFKGGELDGFANADMSKDFVERVEKIEGVKAVLPIYVTDGRISAGNTPFYRMEAVEDLKTFNSMLNIKYDSDTVKKDMEKEFGGTRNILLSKDCLRQRNWKVGDTVSLSGENKSYDYKILGCFQSRADNSEAIIPAAFAEKDFNAGNYGMLAYSANNPDAVMAQIRNLFGNQFNWSRTVEEFKKDALTIVNSFLDPMKKLSYFILLLAAVGVINNLLINYIQKRRTIAMYKSVGMSRGQNIRITIIEGLTSGLIGAGMGLLTAWLELKTIFIVAGPRISVKPDFDPAVFLTTGLAGILITLTGSVVPILKGSRMKLVEEIKSE